MHDDSKVDLRHMAHVVVAAQLAPLLFRRAAPDAGFLPVSQCPTQADPPDRAAAAHLLGRRDLRPGRPDIAVREEQLGVTVAAGGMIEPARTTVARGQHGQPGLSYPVTPRPPEPSGPRRPDGPVRRGDWRRGRPAGRRGYSRAARPGWWGGTGCRRRPRRS